MKPEHLLLLLATGLLELSSCQHKPICSDGTQNGYETGIDCGGPDCPPCYFCNDGKKNGQEEGVDCGGPDCPPCGVNIEWSVCSKMPSPRTFTGGVLFQDKFYIVGGTSSMGTKGTKRVDVFDLATRTWDTLPDLHVLRGMPAVEELGGKLYVLGGIGRHNSFSIPSIEIYDPELNKWELIENAMDPPRFLFGSCVYKGKIYVVAGATGINVDGGEWLTSAQVYDPETGEWADLPDLSMRRYGVKAVVWEDKIYAIGGGVGYLLPPVEVFDPAHPELGWVAKSSLKLPKRYFGCELIGDKIFCIGGLGESDAQGPFNWATSSVEVYLPKEDTTLMAPSMAFRRMQHLSCVWKGQIFVFGGIESAGWFTSSVEEVECGVVK